MNDFHDDEANKEFFLKKKIQKTLVAQHMLHRDKIDGFLYPNFMYLRPTFQKCKRKVPPPSLPPVKNKKMSFFKNRIFFPEIFFFSVIQAKVVQFFTCWKQKKNRKDQKNFFYISECRSNMNSGQK